ncbi:MAG: SOS response-associated peptidase [Acidimicrobiales bacterium]
MSRPKRGRGSEPSYNVAPTNEVYAVRADHGHRSLAALRWGLVPFWAKDAKIGSKMINARSETVSSKPAFRAAYKRRRCLIPADGFFEWSKVEGAKRKQPFYIYRTDGEPLVFAGLWESWRPRTTTTPRS